MEPQVNFDNIRSHVSSENWHELSLDLVFLTKELKTEIFRSSQGKDVFNLMNSVLPKLWQQLDEQSFHVWNNDGEVNILLQNTTECFRTLRNVCAGSTDNQDLISLYPDILTTVHKLLYELCAISTIQGVVGMLRCGIQFLGNLCVGNVTNQVEIWNKFLPCISKMVTITEDPTLNNYCSMLIHSCLITRTETKNMITVNNLDRDFQTVVKSILNILMVEDVEWGLLIIEDVLLIPHFIENLKLTEKQRIFIMEVMISVLKKTDLGNSQPINITNLLYLANQIHENSTQILSIGMMETSEAEIGLLLIKMLEVLGLATSSLPDVYTDLQNYIELLSTAINLLKGIEEIGKTGSNHFSSVGKLSQLQSVDTDHPVFGLKRDLIRLIANMVNKHKRNQDRVRELDGIPLLLNQTNIDGKNPYITQWVVLAIHNLCEDNKDNKTAISNLQLQGVANNQYVLNELGIETCLEGDKVVIKTSKFS